MRVQVNLSDEMVNKVDTYSSKMGLSRSALCCYLIAQGILGLDKSMSMLDTIGEKVGENLIDKKEL